MNCAQVERRDNHQVVIIAGGDDGVAASVSARRARICDKAARKRRVELAIDGKTEHAWETVGEVCSDLRKNLQWGYSR
jgi:hypothetical protein